MMYRVQVLATVTELPYRSGPGVTYPIIGNYKTGESFIIDDQMVGSDDTIWFRNQETQSWCIFKTSNVFNLKIVKKIEQPQLRAVQPLPGGIINTTMSYNAIKQTIASATDAFQTTMTETINNTSPQIPSVGTDMRTEAPYQNTNAYPSIVNTNQNGEYMYDYTLNTSAIDAAVDTIRKNLNIPSLYTPIQLNRLMHTQFNRYKILYPDYERGPLIPYVFFTRPDLNIFDSSGKVLDQFYAQPQLQYIITSNPQTARSLTLDYTSEHEFIPLLCNRVGSLDIQDEVLDVVETGETFTGYKSQYSKHGIRSMTAGQLSIKFPETYNLAITNLHQIWCGYQSCVYRGSLDPKEEYIGGKILDYACDIYYFLTDKDGIIRFWTKYYGCFPGNVNKGIFSYDSGSLVQFPEANITYYYIHKEDLSPDTISEFNSNAKVPQNVTTVYKGDHSDILGHYESTWAGPPFIQEIFMDEGEATKIQRFVLRHKPAPSDSFIDGAVRISPIKF